MKLALSTHRGTTHGKATESRSVQNVKDRSVVCSGGARSAYVAAAKRPRFCDTASNVDPKDVKTGKDQGIPDLLSTQICADIDSSPKSTVRCPAVLAEISGPSYAPLDRRKPTDVPVGFTKVSHASVNFLCFSFHCDCTFLTYVSS
jgi:hypothetical protein